MGRIINNIVAALRKITILTIAIFLSFCVVMVAIGAYVAAAFFTISVCLMVHAADVMDRCGRLWRRI